MKIILLKDIHKVGKKYDVVQVADGFALNSLMPTKAAEIATEKNIAKYSKLKDAEKEARILKEKDLLSELENLSKKTFEIKAKANELGSLFASIHKEEISEVIKVDTLYIHIEKQIKEIGNHIVKIKVQDKVADINITVSAQE